MQLLSEQWVIHILRSGRCTIHAENLERSDALYWASRDGHETVVIHLLAGLNVNINGRKTGGKVPLIGAVEGGYETIARLLVNGGADVNTQGGPHGNALQEASQNGSKDIVKLLLDRGAEVNAQGGLYSNALQAASRYGYKDIIKLLLDRGAEVNTQGGPYGNALQAARIGHEPGIESLLIARGAI